MDYTRTEMRKDIVLRKLKERGHRITKQRMVLLDIILNEECSCCKEIYYKATEKNPDIGISTVYRLVNSLEEKGAISRSDLYRIKCDTDEEADVVCTIELTDGTFRTLSESSLDVVIAAGLQAGGYVREQRIKKITLIPHESDEQKRQTGSTRK